MIFSEDGRINVINKKYYFNSFLKYLKIIPTVRMQLIGKHPDNLYECQNFELEIWFC